MSTSQLAVTSIATTKQKKKKVNTVDGLTSFYFFLSFFVIPLFLTTQQRVRL